MSDIEKFETILNEIPTLKAPGVSGSRIKALNAIAINNVENESTLITTLYTICKSVPSTHKIGTLYVIDLIVRSYSEAAKKQGQEVNSESPEGTFASGVFKISELIESILDDALSLTIDKSTYNKMLKLIDVWERAETFSPELIEHLRSKYYKSTTPPGTPPPRIAELTSKPAIDTNISNANSVLSALDNLQKLSNSSSTTPTEKPSSLNSNTNDILSKLSNLSGNIASNAPQNNSTPPPQNAQSVFDMLQSLQGQANNQNQRSNNFESEYSRRDRSRSPRRNNVNNTRVRSPPRKPSSLPAIPSSLPKIPTINRPPVPPQPQPQQQQQIEIGNQFNQSGSQYQFQQQNFQQSSSASQNQGYPSQQYPPAPVQPGNGGQLNVEGNPNFRPRNVGFDQSVPQGTIKVFSRTLFFGGITRDMDEAELSRLLAPYATVQSLTINTERKHAFVKVYSRPEAEAIMSSFNQDNSLPIRTRWGVGFGPRDCCNYQNGVSMIPITRLTEADRTWIEQAQWGGSGGQPIVSGLVIDEPDIEIGSGLSSKAMSKKMPTNSARNGPKSNMGGEAGEEYSQPPKPFQGDLSQLNALQGLFNQSQNQNSNPPQPQFYQSNYS